MNQLTFLALLSVLLISAYADDNHGIDWSRVVSRSSGRIVGGEEVIPHSHPYIVALLVHFEINDVLCHGSIVTETAILTTAFCISDSISTQVIAGAHDIRTVEPTQQRRTSSNYRIHPEYVWDRQNFDIATVLFETPLIFDFFVEPVWIPTTAMENEQFAGVSAIVTGWGSMPEPNVWGTLRTTQNTVLDNEECAAYIFPISPNNMCLSTSGGRGPCAFDEGAPLTIIRATDYFLIGLYSFIPSNYCDLGFPAFFTRVTTHIDWIWANVQQNS